MSEPEARGPEEHERAGGPRSGEIQSRSGKLRRRLPVAAKIAFATAGAIGGVPGSPTPPMDDEPVSTRCTDIAGASARRTAS